MVQAGQTQAVPIADCAQREMVDVAGTLRAVTRRPRGASLTMEADLFDGTGNITLVWLGRRDIPGIEPGRKLDRARAAGHHPGRADHLQPVLRAPAHRGRPGLTGAG